MAGQAYEILRPTKDNRKVIIYCHGVGEDQRAPRLNFASVKEPIVALLNQFGYTIAASNAHGTNWGNDAAIEDYEKLHNYVVSLVEPTDVFWWCESMGGISSLNTILQTNVRADGWYGLEPATNLGSLYGTGPAQINTAYSITAELPYATQTRGHDPMLYPGSAYAGLPMRFVASAGDTAIPKTNHTDALRTLVTGHAVENSLLTATGNHGDASHYVPIDVVSFFNRHSRAKVA